MSGHQGEPAAPSDAESLCRALIVAATSCPHTIDAKGVHLMYDAKQPGHNALRQLADRLMTFCATNFPAVPAPEGWRPIETAPKDGSLFLCWVAAVRYVETDDGQQCQHDVSQPDFCEWRTHRDTPDGGWFEPCCGQIGDAQRVTHWMPLPGAPKEG